MKDPQKLEEHKNDFESMPKAYDNEFGKGAYEFRNKAIDYYLKMFKSIKIVLYQ